MKSNYWPKKEIEVIEVVVSILVVRGKGTEGDPLRRVVQVYTKQGELIAEYDPEQRDKKK